jgi:hypothetical protein
MPRTTVPDRPSAVSGVFRRPFREQVAFFRQKLGRLVPTRRWDDLVGAEHDRAFMVAGAQKADLLAELAASVDRAIAEGKSLDSFRKDFAAAVERHDWRGWTGEGTKAGRAWRTRTIYRTNASVSYAAGRRAQLEAADWPLWVYRHGGSKEPRPEHLDFDGIALPPDHPFWEKFYPPSDWGCSCYVVGARSARGVRRLGGDPEKTLPEGWDRIDQATGEPAGIGKGWGYAPGASVSPAVRASAEKVRQWEYQIGKAFLGDLPDEARDAISSAYRRLPSVADDVRRYARRVLGEAGDTVVQPNWTLGGVTSEQSAAIATMKDIDVRGFDFSLAVYDIRHVQRRHGGGSETPRGQSPVTSADYAYLPAILSSPDTMADVGVSDIGEPLLRFEKKFGSRRYVAVFAVRKGRRTLGLKTFYIIGT